MRVIAFFSHIPHSGKTIACVNIAVALARLSRRVLVLDLDSQAEASLAFGVTVPLADSIGTVLLAARPMSVITRPTIIERVWLAPASAELSHLDEMNCKPDADSGDAHGRWKGIALWLALDALTDAYDEVLLDCPAQPAFMHHLALLASSDVVVPINVAISHLQDTLPDLQVIVQAQAAGGGPHPLFNGFLPIHTHPHGNWRAQRGEADQYQLPHFSPIPYTPDLRAAKLLTGAESARPATAAFRHVARELMYGLGEARRRAAQLKHAPGSLTPPSQRLSALGAHR